MPAAKLGSLLTLMIVASVVLVAGSLAGAWLVDVVHPGIDLPEEVPIAEIGRRAVRVCASGLLVVALAVGVVGGVLLLAWTLIAATRRDPGLYQ